MEVHHPHQPAHTKKWTAYLLEFFMLFLAVFLGFVAENIRENKVEKKRGLEYIKSFVEDLRTDTSQFAKLIIEFKSQDTVLNTIYACFDTINMNSRSNSCLKNIITNALGFTDFVYTDRTMQQLKNAGGLRLIRDKEITDSIILYDALVREDLIHQEVMENIQQITINAHISMISFNQLKKLSYRANLTNSDTNSSFLLSNDKRELNQYFNQILSFKQNCYRQLTRLQELKEKASNLIIFLNKKLGD